MIKNTDYLIIGNGAAGYFAAQEIRKNDKNGEIIILSKEPVRTYIRTLLAKCILEPLPEEKLFLIKNDWYEKNNIKQILEREVISIDDKNKNVILDNKDTIKFKKLIIATGSYNFIPPLSCSAIEDKKQIDSFNYSNIKGLHSIRSLDDSLKLGKEIKKGDKALVVGGGLLGLEAAWELLNLGLDVTVVEFFDRLLPRQLDKEASRMFKEIADKSGINLILNDSAAEIITKKDNNENNMVEKVKLSSGKEIETDLVVFSIGIRPNTSIVKNTNIDINKGILVNNNMETSSKNIYASGDAAEINGFVYGTWPAALAMGRVAGANASGKELTFQNLVLQTTFTALNAKVFSAGNVNFEDPELDFYSYKNAKDGVFKKVFFKDDKLVAGILMGDISKSTRIVKGIENCMSKKEMLDSEIL